jgi:glycosyltransferase involved in cell wall biosynthesis
VILIEDGSPDNALDICRQLEQEYEKVKLFQHPNGENRGAGASRNLGLTKAKHSYIVFLDADDELIGDRFTIINDYLKATFNADIIIHGAIFRKHNMSKNFVPGSATLIWEALSTSALGNTSCITWRKKFLEEIGGWNENQPSSQEYELLFRSLKNGAKIYLDKNLGALINRRQDSLSTSNLSKSRLVYAQLRLDIWNYAIEYHIINSGLEKILFSQIIKKLFLIRHTSKFEIKVLLESLPTFSLRNIGFKTLLKYMLIKYF